MAVSRLSIRKQFFLDAYSSLSKTLPEIYSADDFDEQDASYLSALYFLMSDAYKTWRLPAGHSTNNHKKAGLTIAALMAMRPIRPTRTVPDMRAFYANQVFGFWCATGILNSPIGVDAPEERDQFYAWLDTVRLPSTQPFLHDAAAGAAELPTSLSLSVDEVSVLDMIVQRVGAFCAPRSPQREA